MATEGLVTVTIKGKVVMKIVAGSEGMNAALLARKIIDNPAIARNTTQAYLTAINVGFGEETSLVVIGMIKEVHKIDADLSELYRSTFDQPAFNPRSESGEVEHYQLVALE